MKIKYANFYICGAENPPSNFSLSIKKTLQTDKAIGFENAIVSDMGNCVCTVSFGVENIEREITQTMAEMQRQIEILEREISEINSKLEEAVSQLQNIRRQI